MAVGNSVGRMVLIAAMLLALAGCKSRQQLTNEAALEQARLMAGQTNSVMKVVTVDAEGRTMVTLVQPPERGAKTQRIVTQTLAKPSSAAPGARLPVLPIITPADAPEAPLQP